MKLDMEIIRAILIQVQNECQGKTVSSKNIVVKDVENNSENAIFVEHFRLLIEEANFIHGNVITNMPGERTILYQDLTWSGHQFLAEAQNEKVWAKFKEWLLENGGSVSISVAQSILTELAKKMLFS